MSFLKAESLPRTMFLVKNLYGRECKDTMLVGTDESLGSSLTQLMSFIRQYRKVEPLIVTLNRQDDVSESRPGH